jgi:hypothetical protein
MLAITAGTVSVQGALIFSSTGAVIDMSGSPGTGTLNVGGLMTVTNGTLTSGTGSTVNFNGTADQTIPIGVSSVVYNNLSINNTSVFAGATLNGAITATNVKGNVTVGNGTNAATLDNGGNAIAMGAGKSFSVANNSTFKLTGASGMVTGGTHNFGATSTVDYAGIPSQTIGAESYGHLTLSGNGTKTAGGPISVQGNFTNKSTFSGSTHTVTMTGITAQIIGGSNPTTFTNLTIDKASSRVKLENHITVSGVLALGTASNPGVIISFPNTLTANGTVTPGHRTGVRREDELPRRRQSAQADRRRCVDGSIRGRHGLFRHFRPDGLFPDQPVDHRCERRHADGNDLRQPAPESFHVLDQHLEVRREELEADAGGRTLGRHLRRDIHVRPGGPGREPQYRGAGGPKVRRPDVVLPCRRFVVDGNHRVGQRLHAIQLQ